MIKLLSVFSLAMLLSSCATNYQQRGVGGGFSESRLDENVFRVTFSGNGYTNKERAVDFTLLRSAELAIEHGYNYFVIIETDSHISTETYTTPTTYHSSVGSAGLVTTTAIGGQSYNLSKPQVSNTIVCFEDKQSNTFNYNAQFIYRELRDKYQLTDSNSSPKKRVCRPLGAGNFHCEFK